MTAVKSKAAKKRKRAEPCVRLATRFVIVCYQHFDLWMRRPIELSYLGYTQAFKTHIQMGDLAKQLPFWFWRILAARMNRKDHTTCPMWLIAEEELST